MKILYSMRLKVTPIHLSVFYRQNYGHREYGDEVEHMVMDSL